MFREGGMDLTSQNETPQEENPLENVDLEARAKQLASWDFEALSSESSNQRLEALGASMEEGTFHSIEVPDEDDPEKKLSQGVLYKDMQGVVHYKEFPSPFPTHYASKLEEAMMGRQGGEDIEIIPSDDSSARYAIEEICKDKGFLEVLDGNLFLTEGTAGASKIATAGDQIIAGWLNHGEVKVLTAWVDRNLKADEGEKRASVIYYKAPNGRVYMRRLSLEEGESLAFEEAQAIGEQLKQAVGKMDQQASE